MMKSILFVVVIGVFVELCICDSCNNNNVCEACNAQSCTWCATGASQGQCFSTSTGAGNCTALSGQWNGTCTTCSSAPTTNWCIVPSNNVLTTLSSSCVTTNTNGWSFNATDNCSNLIELDGEGCFAALFSLACSTFCGPCTPLTYNPASPPKPCKAVCDNVPYRCIGSYAQGCLASYLSQCDATNQNCFNVSADPTKFGLVATTGDGTTTSRVTTGTTGTTGNHLSTTGIQHSHNNDTDTNSTSVAAAMTPSALFLTFTAAAVLPLLSSANVPQ